MPFLADLVDLGINLMDHLHEMRKQPLPRMERLRTDTPPLSRLPDRVAPIHTLRDRSAPERIRKTGPA